MNLTVGQRWKKFMFFALFFSPGYAMALVDVAPCSQVPSLYGGGYWWKGTSLAGTAFGKSTVEYISTDGSGLGLYRLRAPLTLTAGVQNYYQSTTMEGPWSRANLPEGVLPAARVTACEWSYMVWAKSSIIYPPGGGEILVTYKNTTPLPDAYPGVIAGGYHSKVDVDLYPGEYMAGVGAQPFINTNVDLQVTLKVVSKVNPGIYNLVVTIPVSAVSAWYALGTSYWWQVNPSGSPVYNDKLSFPITVRINEQGYPSDPTVSCSVNTARSTLSHGQLRADLANGDERQNFISIQCNGSSTANIILTGGEDVGSGTAISVKMGDGVSSSLSLSNDRVNWHRYLMSVPLKSGGNSVYIRSVLDVKNGVASGLYTGSAVAIVNIF